MNADTEISVDQGKHIQDMLSNWREHPAINPVLEFSTWLVPNPALQKMLKEPAAQPYLATHRNSTNVNDDQDDEFVILQHIHPRIKVIQDFNKTHKLLLRRTSSTKDKQEANDANLSKILSKYDIRAGPSITKQISYKQLEFGYILERLLQSSDETPAPTAYEQIGHIAHFNLKAHHVPYGKLIGQVLIDCNPTIETVVNKIAPVSGPYRTYELEFLAGREETQTTVVEHGVSMDLDVSNCYWCTRLSGERQALLKEEIKRNQIVADVFCGVGALCLLSNRDKDCTIWANDWNPDAIQFFEGNIAKNNLESQKFHLSCGDTYDYMIQLGMESPSSSSAKKKDKGASKDDRLPDHIVMNFPLEAPNFLGALRWWPSQKVQLHYNEFKSYPRVHVYTFSRADGSRSEEDVAIDMIADKLVPLMGGYEDEEEDDQKSMSGSYRLQEMEEEYNTNITTRQVRDVAPGKVVVCVSFSVTPKLLRSMQGDFV